MVYGGMRCSRTCTCAGWSRPVAGRLSAARGGARGGWRAPLAGDGKVKVGSAGAKGPLESHP